MCYNVHFLLNIEMTRIVDFWHVTRKMSVLKWMLWISVTAARLLTYFSVEVMPPLLSMFDGLMLMQHSQWLQVLFDTGRDPGISFWRMCWCAAIAIVTTVACCHLNKRKSHFYHVIYLACRSLLLSDTTMHMITPDKYTRIVS